MRKEYKWERAWFPHGTCDKCDQPVTNRLFERDRNFRGDDEMRASACDEHFAEIKKEVEALLSTSQE